MLKRVVKKPWNREKKRRDQKAMLWWQTATAECAALLVSKLQGGEIEVCGCGQ
jgi:hypothetical protein